MALRKFFRKGSASAAVPPEVSPAKGRSPSAPALSAPVALPPMATPRPSNKLRKKSGLQRIGSDEGEQEAPPAQSPPTRPANKLRKKSGLQAGPAGDAGSSSGTYSSRPLSLPLHEADAHPGSGLKIQRAPLPEEIIAAWTEDDTTYLETNAGIVVADDAQAAAVGDLPRRQRYTGPRMFASEPSNDTPQNLSPPEQRIARLSPALWHTITTYLSPLDAAHLAHASKMLRLRLGAHPWDQLEHPDNKAHKLAFLHSMDRHLPDHLLCSPCATYHARTDPGREELKPNYVHAPVFSCPQRGKAVLPRARLVHGRELPYSFVQLALRSHRHSPQHGISADRLAKRWKCRDSQWKHDSRYYVHDNGHLFMRVTSTCFAEARQTPNQERLLLFSRSDYAPYFSVCEHWSRNNLLQMCKCALSHIPEAPESVMTQLRQHPSIDWSKRHRPIRPKQCDSCRTLKRCPECPSEYLIQLKLVDDNRDLTNQFKQAIVVTRWSDLGDGSSPSTSPEWAACRGEAKFDSFAAVRNATLCSLFEGAVSKSAPRERCEWLQNGRVVDGKIEDVY